MALLGKAAVVIWCAMDFAYLDEHDVWHSTEHLPERMGIPGFLRGRRCAAVDAKSEPRFVLYEIEDIAVSTSAPYLERLNNPTHWSKRVMANCRLSRTLCRVASSDGSGIGAALLTIRLSPLPGREKPLEDWLVASALPQLARRPGIVGAHLLQRDAATLRPQTSEEKLRQGGADASVDWVVLVEGTDPDIAAAVLDETLAEKALAERGAARAVASLYRLSHVMDGHGQT
jgi:hypothetical protein